MADLGDFILLLCTNTIASIAPSNAALAFNVGRPKDYLFEVDNAALTLRGLCSLIHQVARGEDEDNNKDHDNEEEDKDKQAPSTTKKGKGKSKKSKKSGRVAEEDRKIPEILKVALGKDGIVPFALW